MKSRLTIFIFLVQLLVCSSMFAQAEYNYDKNSTISNRLIVKLKNNKSTQSEIVLKKVFEFAGVSKIEKLFKKENIETTKSLGLDNLFSITFNSPYSTDYVVGKVSGNKQIEYVEPHNICTIAFEPDDPNYTSNEILQWNLRKVDAEQAWDINQGSSDIIIAIVDTGIDYDHEDLSSNIAPNVGYDFGSNDDDPREDQPVHGTYIAGVASAVTNNGIGNASIGFNTKFMSIKVTEGNARSFPFPFEAIKWAVDNGAHVINCSFTSYKKSKAEQELMNYANESGVLVIAAAGNDNRNSSGYPAAYQNVLSVSATDNEDAKWSGSNYGLNVDVAAPGADIYSTWWQWDSDETREYDYRVMHGTSQATAMVSGLAGLVKNQFPNYSPNQIAEQIRVTADNIYNDTLNVYYKNKLGYGRINAFNALSNTDAKSVRVTNLTYTDVNDGSSILQPGDTFQVSVDFKNYLAPVNNLEIKLRSNTEGVTLIDSVFTISSVSTGESFNNSDQKFTFELSPSIEENLEVEFYLNIEADDYSDFYWFNKEANPTFQTQTSGSLALSITNTGGIGFDVHGDPPQIGEGFIFENGQNILFEGAFMYGNNEERVADNAHTVYLESKSLDFESVEPFAVGTSGDKADYTGEAAWKESKVILGIETSLTSETYNNAPNDKYIILNYSLKNTGTVPKDTVYTGLDSLFVGIFLDWDLPGGNSYDWLRDSVAYDSVDNFIYSFDVDNDTNGIFVGAAFLNEEGTNIYPILNNGTDNDIIIDNADRALISFTKEEKWKTLSSGKEKRSAGIGDVSFVVSGGPFKIDSNNTETFSFAIAADKSFDGLKEAIQAARDKKNDSTKIETKIEIPESPKLAQNYPNPFNPETIIEYQLTAPEKVTLRVYDILGRKVATLVNETKKAGYHKVRFSAYNLASGVYIYNISTPSFSESKKMMLIR